MQVVSVALLVLGLVGVVVGGLKFREQTEWEHWAAKFTSMLIIGGGVLLLGIGAMLFFFL